MGMSWVCETCLLSCDVQVLSVETVDNNREGQVSSCRWTGAVMDGCGGFE